MTARSEPAIGMSEAMERFISDVVVPAFEEVSRELERHGLSSKEIDAVCEGAQPPGNQRLWKRALEQNALWGEIEEAILRLLPESAQGHPWSIAAIGEEAAFM